MSGFFFYNGRCCSIGIPDLSAVLHINKEKSNKTRKERKTDCLILLLYSSFLSGLFDGRCHVALLPRELISYYYNYNYFRLGWIDWIQMEWTLASTGRSLFSPGSISLLEARKKGRKQGSKEGSEKWENQIEKKKKMMLRKKSNKMKKKHQDGSFFGGRCHVALFVPNNFFLSLSLSLHFWVNIFQKEKQIEMKWHGMEICPVYMVMFVTLKTVDFPKTHSNVFHISQFTFHISYFFMSRIYHHQRLPASIRCDLSNKRNSNKIPTKIINIQSGRAEKRNPMQWSRRWLINSHVYVSTLWTTEIRTAEISQCFTWRRFDESKG